MHIDSSSALCVNCHTYAPNQMVSTVIVGGPMPSGVTITQQPAPVSATEPDAVRTLREGMRGQHALFNVNQEYVCAVAPLLEYIDALTARLAKAERVTEEQVERAAIALYASTGANASSFRTEHHYAQKTYYDKARRALTAARGGG